MRKNKATRHLKKFKSTEQQLNQPSCRIHERSPVKRTAFHRIGGRKQ